MALVFAGCSSDDDEEFIFDIWCGAELNGEKQSCTFFFFEDGEYASVERNDLSSSIHDYGRATATKKDGTTSSAIGYAHYIASSGGYAKAYYHDWVEKNPSKGNKRRSLLCGLLPYPYRV